MKRHREQNKLMYGVALLSIMALLIAGCGGGGGSDSSDLSGDPAGSDTLTGVFADSPVEGLEYETPTESGYTDAEGRFQYRETETVRFFLGSAQFGEAPAKPYMTPMDIVDGAVDVDDWAVTNMARFLQGLDADGDPENGIQIPQEAEDALNGRPVHFRIDVGAFEVDAHVQGVFDELNQRGVFGNGQGRGLRGVEAARQHMREHMPEDWEGPPAPWRPGDDVNDDGTADVLPKFLDENENGINDYAEEAAHYPADDPHGHEFVDENGDGICDLAQDGSKTWHGPGFVDKDGDGVCDYWDKGQRQFNRHAGMPFIDENEDRVNDIFQFGTHQGPDHEFVDENGDGICDRAQDGSNAWHGPLFDDEDDDGVSDHWQEGGRGHGNRPDHAPGPPAV